MASPFELPNDGVRTTPDVGTESQDPWASERYTAYGRTQTDAQLDSTTSGATMPVDANAGKLQFADQQLMMLSPQDAMKVTQLWAAANGMNANDAASFQQSSTLRDGQTIGVGPYQLDARTIVNDWCNGMINGEGNVDRGALDNYVQQGRLSPETADAMSTPEFMNFMQSLAQGKQPTAEELAHFLPPDAQQCIAMDLTNAMAAGVAMNGGSLDAGSIVASLNARTPITPQEATDPKTAEVIQAVNAQFAQVPDQQTSAQNDAAAQNPMDATAQNLDPNVPYILPGQSTVTGGTDGNQLDPGIVATNTPGAEIDPGIVAATPAGSEIDPGIYANPTTARNGITPSTTGFTPSLSGNSAYLQNPEMLNQFPLQADETAPPPTP